MKRTRRKRTKGLALVSTMLVMVFLLGFSLALFQFVTTQKGKFQFDWKGDKATYIAEAGLSRASAVIDEWNFRQTPEDEVVSKGYALEDTFSGGKYHVRIEYISPSQRTSEEIVWQITSKGEFQGRSITEVAREAGYDPLRKIVVFADQAALEKAGARISQYGTVVEKMPVLNSMAVQLNSVAGKSGLLSEPGVTAIANDLLVQAYADPHGNRPPPRIIYRNGKPTINPDPLSLQSQNFYELSYSNRIVNYPWGIRRMNVPQAWGFSTGSGVKIAVLDTGLGPHQEFAAQTAPAGGCGFTNDPCRAECARGLSGSLVNDLNNFMNDPNNRLSLLNPPQFTAWDANDEVAAGETRPGFKNNPWDNCYADDQAHGTLVTGILAAQGNGTKIRGVAPNALIYPVKVLNKFGWGRFSDIAMGLLWASANRMKIANLSFGINREALDSQRNPQYNSNQAAKRLLQRALQQARNSGITLVCAAGPVKSAGTNHDVSYPAAFPECIAVGASNDQDKYVAASPNGNLRPTWGPEIAFIAPGQDINTTNLTVKKSKKQERNPRAYGIRRFTYVQVTWAPSLAAAHVTGLVALKLQKSPNLTPNQVLDALRRAATPLSNPLPGGVYDVDPRQVQGYGLIDAYTLVTR